MPASLIQRCARRGGARFPGPATFKTIMTADRSTCLQRAFGICACRSHSKMHAQLCRMQREDGDVSARMGTSYVLSAARATAYEP